MTRISRTNHGPLLAQDRFPQPHGTPYYQADLLRPHKVAELFAQAQILRASITRQGWKFLWNRYGLDGLLELGRRLAWPDQGYDPEQAARQLWYGALIAGYDPVSGLFGAYDETDGAFHPELPETQEVGV
jgi:hypothetical protein